MENCIKYCEEIKDLMVDLNDALEDGDTEKVGEIIETCRCALNDIEENLYSEEENDDEDEEEGEEEENEEEDY